MNRSLNKTVDIQVKVPGELGRLRLPAGLNCRLQHLLDMQDQGKPLSVVEREEAEGLVDLAEFLSFLRLRSQRAVRGRNKKR
jgi:hypothetical protein